MITAALLLTDPSPHLRLRVLTELFKKPWDDDEVREVQLLCETDDMSRNILTSQLEDGSWKPDSIQGTGEVNNIITTSRVIKRLAFLGFPPDHPAILKGIASLFAGQNKSGSWSPGKKGGSNDNSAEAAPLYSALILQAIALAGHGETREAQKAYKWLCGFRLPEGTWPAGIVKGNYRGIAGYRRLSHSKFGCRSTTTAMAAVLAYHPVLRKSEMARQALDMILGTELKESGSIGVETARTLGFEQSRGLLTYYVLYDSSFILDLCARTGIGKADERVAEIISFLLTHQGPYGLWEYEPNPRAARWITFEILRTLAAIDNETSWVSMTPRSGFQKYPQKQKRF